MQTLVLRVNPRSPEKRHIQGAVAYLKKGGLVVFPTETVYGLGALAMDPKAVAKIFRVKNRPPDHPLIVHIARLTDLPKIACHIPSRAYRLAKKFWPGPLTLVLKKSPRVPSIVTAGGQTVAVRMPAHPIALALIRAAGEPLVATSANVSGKPSPTIAAQALAALKGKVPLVLDGGRCPVGVASTVFDLTQTPPVVLRKGRITATMLQG